MAARAAALLLLVLAASSCGGTKLSAPVCSPSTTALSVGPLYSEATGQHTLEIDLTNQSRATCALKGFPTLHSYDDAGVELPFEYRHTSDQMIVVRKPKQVVLRPGGHAAFVLNKYRCDVQTTGVIRTLAVRLPGTQAGRLLHVPRNARVMQYCDVKGSIEVELTPILASARDASPAS